MPKMEGRAPARRTRNLAADLTQGLLIDGALVYVPGNRKFRCLWCDVLFDTFAPPYGASIVWERNMERIGTACGECVIKIEEHDHA